MKQLMVENITVDVVEESIHSTIAAKVNAIGREVCIFVSINNSLINCILTSHYECLIHKAHAFVLVFALLLICPYQHN